MHYYNHIKKNMCYLSKSVFFALVSIPFCPRHVPLGPQGTLPLLSAKALANASTTSIRFPCRGMDTALGNLGCPLVTRDRLLLTALSKRKLET